MQLHITYICFSGSCTLTFFVPYLNISVLLKNGILSLLSAIQPIFIAVWLNKQAEASLKSIAIAFCALHKVTPTQTGLRGPRICKSGFVYLYTVGQILLSLAKIHKNSIDLGKIYHK